MKTDPLSLTIRSTCIALFSVLILQETFQKHEQESHLSLERSITQSILVALALGFTVQVFRWKKLKRWALLLDFSFAMGPSLWLLVVVLRYIT